MTAEKTGRTRTKNMEFMRGLELFSGLSDEDLSRLHERAEPVELSRGDVLMEEGSEGDSLYIVLEGEFEITKRAGERDVVLAVRGGGEVMGEMSMLIEAPRSATVTALGPSRLLRLSHEAFLGVLRSSSEAALAILSTVTERLQHTEAMLRQHEKLSALGTLAAGLAHELNNPAAAIRRSAEQLGDLLEKWQLLSHEVGRLAVEQAQKNELARLRAELIERGGNELGLSSLERSDRETELESWLEDHGIERAWEWTATLVARGWTPDDLGPTREAFGADHFATLVKWLGCSSEALSLTDEISRASGRISDIVSTVKTYSYLDQGPEQDVDVHQGLEDTLVILRHKTGEGIRIVREFDPDLPEIEAFGSELTQVWTNLIDNAIDALDGEGSITLQTRALGDEIAVSVCDDGPGIPENIQDRIFDPFFTTKPPGVGTGLGLHISYTVVTQRHGGSIDVESEPGRTCFIIRLPVQR